MHIVFYEFVTNFGGSVRSLVELADRLSVHARVTIVDVYGSCQAFREAVGRTKVGYHIVCPNEKGQHVGGSSHPVSRAIAVARSARHLLDVRRRTRKLMLEINPSVVSCNQYKSASMIGYTWSLRHIPLMLYMRGWYRPDQLPWYARWLCRYRAQALFALSHATKAALRCSGIDHQKIHVLHNPIDAEAFRRAASRPPDPPLPQAHRPVRILLPADIIPTKGQHTAVEAMRYILDAGHDAALWLAGKHVSREGYHKTYPQRVQELAEKLGVGDRICWLGSRTDMARVMNASSVVIFPSHSEGQGRVVLEAMSLGKPVAATPAGGILDMVFENMTGLLFEIDDPEGLAQCVDRYIRDPQFADQVGQRGQEYIRLSFRPEQQTAKALEVFSQVAGERGK